MCEFESLGYARYGVGSGMGHREWNGAVRVLALCIDCSEGTDHMLHISQ